jgi:hypothetical protein
MYLGAACPRYAKRTVGVLLVAQHNLAQDAAVHNAAAGSGVPRFTGKTIDAQQNEKPIKK